MLRKAKITAVPIDVQSDQALQQVDGQEHKTEAEQMTDIISEANVTESTLSNEDEPSIQRAPKARAKRVSKKEPVMTEPEVEATSSFDEVQAEVVMSKQEPEVEPKVACPDCGKKMFAKTLKYSHGPNCVIHKQKQQSSDESAPNEIQSVTNEWVEHEIQRRLNGRQEERATRREVMVANLVKNAF